MGDPTSYDVRASWRRLIGLAALAAIGLTCRDQGGTQPDPTYAAPVQLAVHVPTVEDAPVIDVGTLNVIVVRNASNELLLDTTILAADARDFELEVNLPLGAPTEELRFVLRAFDTSSPARPVYVDGRVLLATADEALTADIWLTYDGPDAAVTTIAVSAASTLVHVGETVVLTAIAKDNQADPIQTMLRWVSRDPAALSVDSVSGIVTGLAESPGVWVVATNVTGIRDSVPVTVLAAVETIDVTPASPVTLVLGETVTLTAIVTDAQSRPIPASPVQWHSAGSTVASVSVTGVVTALSVGSAPIIATAGGKSDTTVVEVVPAPTPNLRFYTLPEWSTLGAGQFLERSVSRISPFSSSMVVNLSSSDTSIATVPDSVIIPAGSEYVRFIVRSRYNTGTVRITATARGSVPVSVDLRVTQPQLVRPRVALPAPSGAEDGIEAGTSKTIIYTSRPRPTAIRIETADDMYYSHPLNEDLILTLSSSNPSVARFTEATATIPAGSYELVVPVVYGEVGTAVMTASDARELPITHQPLVDSVTVTPPKLEFRSDHPAVTGVGLSQTFQVTNLFFDDPVAVTLRGDASPNTRFSPTSFSVGYGAMSYQTIEVIGTSVGVDTIIMTGPEGVLGDTLIVDVGTPQLNPIVNWPVSMRVGEVVAAFVQPRNHQGRVMSVAEPVTFTIAGSPPVRFYTSYQATEEITAFTLGGSAYTLYIKAVAAGTATVSITSPTYTPYSNTITVNP